MFAVVHGTLERLASSRGLVAGFRHCKVLLLAQTNQGRGVLVIGGISRAPLQICFGMMPCSDIALFFVPLNLDFSVSL